MRIYEERTRPAYKEKVCVKRQCDLCGTKSKSGDWEAGYYEVAESTVRIEVTCKTGESYPDDAYGTEFEIDICPECFKEKLVPWLRSQGAKIEEQRWEW